MNKGLLTLLASFVLTVFSLSSNVLADNDSEATVANTKVITTRTIPNTSPSKQQQPNQSPQSSKQDCSHKWVLQ